MIEISGIPSGRLSQEATSKLQSLVKAFHFIWHMKTQHKYINVNDKLCLTTDQDAPRCFLNDVLAHGWWFLIQQHPWEFAVSIKCSYSVHIRCFLDMDQCEENFDIPDSLASCRYFY